MHDRLAVVCVFAGTVRKAIAEHARLSDTTIRFVRPNTCHSVACRLMSSTHSRIPQLGQTKLSTGGLGFGRGPRRSTNQTGMPWHLAKLRSLTTSWLRATRNQMLAINGRGCSYLTSQSPQKGLGKLNQLRTSLPDSCPMSSQGNYNSSRSGTPSTLSFASESADTSPHAEHQCLLSDTALSTN